MAEPGDETGEEGTAPTREDPAAADTPESEGEGVETVGAEASPSAEEAASEPPEAGGAAEGEAPEGGAPEGEAAPRPDGPPDLAAQEQSEVESFLGPDVRTPVGIPRDYKPSDTSIHELFRVELQDFAGPLDLLLYLIRKHELDIFDIPIKFITERYVEMIDELQALEVDIAAEFLVMAAELTHIKSKMLLPVKEGVAVEEEEDEGDPREELVRRLLEYQKYRDAAHQLGDRDQLGRDIFARNPPNVELVDDLDPGLKSVSIFKLVELMAKLLRRAPTHHEIHFESVSIAERIHYVQAFGEARDGKFTLVQLLDGIVTRAELVVTFIAVLEMTKLGIIRIMMEDLAAWQAASEELERSAAQLEPDEEEAAPVAPAATHEEGSAEAARQLAREIEAEAPELEAMSSVGSDTEDGEPEEPVERPPATPWEDEPLPEIWVQLTGKRFEGDILDDYQ